MKTKIIPFDLKTAKKIQEGEIEGKIITKNKIPCRIVAYCDSGDIFIQRVTLESHCDWCYPYTRKGCYIDGHLNGGTDYDLVLEVPDNASQFKPFDKVLVRHYDVSLWQPAFFWKFFDELSKTPYYTIDGNKWEQCIQYEGNEHLLGTTDKPKED